MASRVQGILRQSQESCYFVCFYVLHRSAFSRVRTGTESARKVENGAEMTVFGGFLLQAVQTREFLQSGETLTVTLGLVSHTEEHSISSEVAVFSLFKGDSTWDIRHVIPINTAFAFKILPASDKAPQLLEIRVPREPEAEGDTEDIVYLYEHTSELMSAFSAGLKKHHGAALKENLAPGVSHKWIKFYTLLRSVSIQGAAGSDDFADALKKKIMSKDGSATESDTTAMWLSKMLKTRQKEFTAYKTMTVFFGTWNVNGQDPTFPLEQWLVCNDVHPDIYCIGFQELDLSASALMLGDKSQASPWHTAIKSALKYVGDYVFIEQKQLVGVLLCVYAKAEHRHKITDIQCDLTPVGIMGVMGNKGGVAIRFNLCDSTFCVVNSHLNAHANNVVRRNQDFYDISHRIAFKGDNGSQITMFDHDFLFWIGDLNYRLNGPDALVRSKIQQQDYTTLLEMDQLKEQIARGLAFEGFQEAPIKFPPTYKYEINTANYCSPEKQRTPSWCDRILWRCKDDECATSLNYKRHELLSSDHRPVSSVFLLKVKSINAEARAQVYQELLNQLDAMENESMPDATLSTNSLSFENVSYMNQQSHTLVLENTGRVMARWRFMSKPGERRLYKPWLMIVPTSGILMPGEKVSIRVTVSVDNETAPALNSGEDKIEDILIMHLENGKDFYINLEGNYQKSCFGMNLDLLSRYPQPVRLSEPVPVDQTDKTLPIPKEIWRVVDFIYRHGIQVPNIFSQSGVGDMELIRTCLDTGESFAPHNFDVHSMAETLIRLLGSLSEPVIPTRLYLQALDASPSFAACRQLIQTQLNTVHYNTFYYLMSFLREILVFSSKNKLSPDSLAGLFASVILRPGIPMSRPTEAILKKKANFILHFLIEEGVPLRK